MDLQHCNMVTVSQKPVANPGMGNVTFPVHLEIHAMKKVAQAMPQNVAEYH